jgi:PAT family beta-lactamase induction signal transducer AmpG
VSSPKPPPPRNRVAVLGALALLYAAQGIPFGFAAEYLQVVLRHGGASRLAIAATGWLQLPWQVKFLWAGLGDHPAVRPRARGVLLALQLALAALMAAYALVGSPRDPIPWFALTAVAALVAATQDVFVDAFAVRTLTAAERGWGNSAQVGGYRLGMILGGGGMLTLSGLVGEGPTLVACGAVIAAISLAAFALRDDETPHPPPTETPTETSPRTPARPAAHAAEIRALARHASSRAALPVAAIALTYKLGLHAAAALIKPMLVDAGWSPQAIGGLAVTLGAAAAIAGSILGGALHRALAERRALQVGAVLQGLAILPLLAAHARGCPRALTSAAVALEHAASGLGTAVLFAALMSATRRSQAALHYTALTSLNALAIGLGGLLGAAVGDLAGPAPAFALAAALCLAPCALLGAWHTHASASASEPPETPAAEPSLR